MSNTIVQREKEKEVCVQHLYEEQIKKSKFVCVHVWKIKPGSLNRVMHEGYKIYLGLAVHNHTADRQRQG